MLDILLEDWGCRGSRWVSVSHGVVSLGRGRIPYLALAGTYGPIGYGFQWVLS